MVDGRCLCLIDLLAVNDGSNDVGLSHLLDVVVQEVAVIDRHIGNLSELDRAHAMLLTELASHIDGHGTQRLLAGDGLLLIKGRFFDLFLSIFFALKNAGLRCPLKGTYVREANNIGDYPL